MYPTLLDGDLIIYKPINLLRNIELTTGAIVVIRSPLNNNDLIIKRIHKTTNTGLDIRGDNASVSIDSRQFGLIHINNLYGLVEKIIKNPFTKNRNINKSLK